MSFRVLSVAVCASAAAWSAGCGGRAISYSDAPRGDLRATRLGRTVLVQVGLQNIPPAVGVLTMGLKLADGTAVYPHTIRWRGETAAELAGCSRVSFVFDGSGDAPVPPVRPDASLLVTFELEKAETTADQGTFTLVLGDPEAAEGCRMGITTTISPRDGSPGLFACVYLPRPGPGEPFQLPPPKIVYVPTVSFHLTERPLAGTPPRADIIAQVTQAGLVPLRRTVALAKPH